MASTYIELGVALGTSLQGIFAGLSVSSSSLSRGRGETARDCGRAEAGSGTKGGAADEGGHCVCNWGFGLGVGCG
jgi:hypothetical protein